MYIEYQENQDQGVETTGVDASQDFEYVDVIRNSESSSSNIGSLDETIVDPFTLLELQDNVEKVNSKVDTITYNVSLLDSKLYIVMKSLFQD